MIAWTSPFGTVRLMPRRISSPSISACRSLISSMFSLLPDVIGTPAPSPDPARLFPGNPNEKHLRRDESGSPSQDKFEAEIVARQQSSEKGSDDQHEPDSYEPTLPVRWRRANPVTMRLEPIRHLRTRIRPRMSRNGSVIRCRTAAA